MKTVQNLRKIIFQKRKKTSTILDKSKSKEIYTKHNLLKIKNVKVFVFNFDSNLNTFPIDRSHYGCRHCDFFLLISEEEKCCS